jgi:hypothetical protein
MTTPVIPRYGNARLYVSAANVSVVNCNLSAKNRLRARSICRIHLQKPIVIIIKIHYRISALKQFWSGTARIAR